MKDIQADLEKCPILKDRAKNLSPEEVEKLRDNYEKYIKPYFPSLAGAEEAKDDTQKPKINKVVSKPRHRRLKELRERSKAFNEPKEETFEFGYNIKCKSKYEFMFSKVPEKTPKREFKEKRKLFSSYPLCLKHTLIFDDNINKVRNAPLAGSFFIADELKAEGNLYYEDGDYYAALELYELAYSTLQWLEITNTEMKEEFNKGHETSLQDDSVKLCQKDLGSDDCEIETRIIMIITLLLNQVVVYCKLKHYKEAVKCCDDGLRITQQSADIYYRRSQAVTYNKASTFEELNQAMENIDTAIKMRPKEESYKRHKEVLSDVLNKKLEYEKKQVEWIVKCAVKKLERSKETQNKNRSIEVIPIKPEKPFEFKVLKKYKYLPLHKNRMKKKYAFTLHFYRVSTKKEDAGKIWEVLKEYQNFGETFWKYSYFYYLFPTNIPPLLFSTLTSETQAHLQNKELEPHFDSVKLARAKDVFFEAKLNIQLFKYAMDLVNEADERKKRIEEKKAAQIRRHSKEGPGHWTSLSVQCCNAFLYLAIGLTLYLIARYYFGDESYFPDLSGK